METVQHEEALNQFRFWGSDSGGVKSERHADWVSFSEVKKRVKLDRVLCAYGVDWLRPSGAQQYRGRCPIHQGQGTEAFHAHLGRNVFHCFACGAGGNVLDFVAAMEGCSMRGRHYVCTDRRTVPAWLGQPSRSEANWLRKKERSTHPSVSDWNWIPRIPTWPGAEWMPPRPVTSEWVIAVGAD
jgi:hypothetical protein